MRELLGRGLRRRCKDVLSVRDDSGRLRLLAEAELPEIRRMIRARIHPATAYLEVTGENESRATGLLHRFPYPSPAISKPRS